MKINLVNKKINQIKADVELVLVDKSLKHKWVKDAKLFKAQGFKGDLEQVLYLPEKGRIYAGVESFKERNYVRVAAAMAAKALRGKDIKIIKCGYYGDDNIKAVVEGVLLGSYVFDKFKKKKSKTINSLSVAHEALTGPVDAKTAKALIKEAQIEAEAQNFVREVVNRPPVDLTPIELAAQAQELTKIENVQVKVYDQKFLQKEKMGAFLAVAQASSNEPQLIHVFYKHPEARKKVVLVGKGVTYDTGGLSLKPTEALRTMKSDMAGGGVIMGVAKAVSELELPIELHVIIGAVENSIGKDAYRPDDVITSGKGITIEIKNTDAEGRMVLADCLYYSQRIKADYYIDIAALTGSTWAGLGDYASSLMSDNQELIKALIEAGQQSDDTLVYFPFRREYKKLLKSEVADIMQIGKVKFGDSIIAATFLKEFLNKENRNKWAHIDVAGPSFAKCDWGPYSTGGTGAGTRLLVHWIKSVVSDK